MAAQKYFCRVYERSVMPWTPLILVTVLFGVICGNRLLDNRLRRPYIAPARTAAPAASDVVSVKNCIKALTEGVAMQSSIGLDETKFLSNLYDCFGTESFSTKNGDLIYPENMQELTASKRDLYSRDTRNFGTNNDFLSDIFALDTTGTLNADHIDSTLAHNDLEKMGHVMSLPLLPSYSAEFYEDLLTDTKSEDVKRAGTAPAIGCDCKIKNDLLDLGQQHFPRYLLNAVCQTDNEYGNEYQQKCWRGSICKPLEYKVKVLTFRADSAQKDPTLAWLPDDLRQVWKFKTATVAAGCFCSY